MGVVASRSRAVLISVTSPLIEMVSMAGLPDSPANLSMVAVTLATSLFGSRRTLACQVSRTGALMSIFFV